MGNSTKKKSDGILLLARRCMPLQKYEGFLYNMHLPISQGVNNEREGSVKGGGVYAK
jgi:hypothetical protein